VRAVRKNGHAVRERIEKDASATLPISIPLLGL